MKLPFCVFLVSILIFFSSLLGGFASALFEANYTALTSSSILTVHSPMTITSEASALAGTFDAFSGTPFSPPSNHPVIVSNSSNCSARDAFGRYVSNPPAGYAELAFSVADNGIYVVTARLQAVDTLHDSLWIFFQAHGSPFRHGPRLLFVPPANYLSFAQQRVGCFYLNSTGPNKLRLQGREAGVMISSLRLHELARPYPTHVIPLCGAPSIINGATGNVGGANVDEGTECRRGNNITVRVLISSEVCLPLNDKKYATILFNDFPCRNAIQMVPNSSAFSSSHETEGVTTLTTADAYAQLHSQEGELNNNLKFSMVCVLPSQLVIQSTTSPLLVQFDWPKIPGVQNKVLEFSYRFEPPDNFLSRTAAVAIIHVVGVAFAALVSYHAYVRMTRFIPKSHSSMALCIISVRKETDDPILEKFIKHLTEIESLVQKQNLLVVKDKDDEEVEAEEDSKNNNNNNKKKKNKEQEQQKGKYVNNNTTPASSSSSSSSAWEVAQAVKLSAEIFNLKNRASSLSSNDGVDDFVEIVRSEVNQIGGVGRGGTSASCFEAQRIGDSLLLFAPDVASLLECTQNIQSCVSTFQRNALQTMEKQLNQTYEIMQNILKSRILKRRRNNKKKKISISSSSKSKNKKGTKSGNNNRKKIMMLIKEYEVAKKEIKQKEQKQQQKKEEEEDQPFLDPTLRISFGVHYGKHFQVLANYYHDVSSLSSSSSSSSAIATATPIAAAALQGELHGVAEDAKKYQQRQNNTINSSRDSGNDDAAHLLVDEILLWRKQQEQEEKRKKIQHTHHHHHNTDKLLLFPPPSTTTTNGTQGVEGGGGGRRRSSRSRRRGGGDGGGLYQIIGRSVFDLARMTDSAFRDQIVVSHNARDALLRSKDENFLPQLFHSHRIRSVTEAFTIYLLSRKRNTNNKKVSNSSNFKSGLQLFFSDGNEEEEDDEGIQGEEEMVETVNNDDEEDEEEEEEEEEEEDDQDENNEEIKKKQQTNETNNNTDEEEDQEEQELRQLEEAEEESDLLTIMTLLHHSRRRGRLLPGIDGNLPPTAAAAIAKSHHHAASGGGGGGSDGEENNNNNNEGGNDNNNNNPFFTSTTKKTAGGIEGEGNIVSCLEKSAGILTRIENVIVLKIHCELNEEEDQGGNLSSSPNRQVGLRSSSNSSSSSSAYTCKMSLLFEIFEAIVSKYPGAKVESEFSGDFLISMNIEEARSACSSHSHYDNSNDPSSRQQHQEQQNSSSKKKTKNKDINKKDRAAGTSSPSRVFDSSIISIHWLQLCHELVSVLVKKGPSSSSSSCSSSSSTSLSLRRIACNLLRFISIGVAFGRAHVRTIGVRQPATRGGGNLILSQDVIETANSLERFHRSMCEDNYAQIGHAQLSVCAFTHAVEGQQQIRTLPLARMWVGCINGPRNENFGVLVFPFIGYKLVGENDFFFHPAAAATRSKQRRHHHPRRNSHSSSFSSSHSSDGSNNPHHHHHHHKYTSLVDQKNKKKDNNKKKKHNEEKEGEEGEKYDPSARPRNTCMVHREDEVGKKKHKQHLEELKRQSQLYSLTDSDEEEDDDGFHNDDDDSDYAYYTYERKSSRNKKIASSSANNNNSSLVLLVAPRTKLNRAFQAAVVQDDKLDAISLVLAARKQQRQNIKKLSKKARTSSDSSTPPSQKITVAAKTETAATSKSTAITTTTTTTTTATTTATKQLALAASYSPPPSSPPSPFSALEEVFERKEERPRDQNERGYVSTPLASLQLGDSSSEQHFSGSLLLSAPSPKDSAVCRRSTPYNESSSFQQQVDTNETKPAAVTVVKKEQQQQEEENNNKNNNTNYGGEEEEEEEEEEDCDDEEEEENLQRALESAQEEEALIEFAKRNLELWLKEVHRKEEERRRAYGSSAGGSSDLYSPY